MIVTLICPSMYLQLPEKTVKTIIADLLETRPENKSTDKIIQDIFTNLCDNNCHHESIKILIDSGKEHVTEYYNSAIKNASLKGNLEIVKLLLSTGKIDVTVQDNFSIRYASQNGHLEIVKLLLSTDKVDVTAQDNYAIKYASRNGHLKIAKLLLLTGKIDLKNITDLNILFILNKIKSEKESINEKKMIQMMNTNGISKIVIDGKNIKLTTICTTNTNCEPSEIINLMNRYNMTECEYDNLLSTFKYRINVQIINTSEDIE